MPPPPPSDTHVWTHVSTRNLKRQLRGVPEKPDIIKGFPTSNPPPPAPSPTRGSLSWPVTCCCCDASRAPDLYMPSSSPCRSHDFNTEIALCCTYILHNARCICVPNRTTRIIFVSFSVKERPGSTGNGPRGRRLRSPWTPRAPSSAIRPCAYELLHTADPGTQTDKPPRYTRAPLSKARLVQATPAENVTFWDPN